MSDQGNPSPGQASGPPSPWLNWDGRILLATVSLRSFAIGFLAVLLGPYLAKLGFRPLQVGILLTTATAGIALYTLLVSLFADILGRRRTMFLLGSITALGSLAFPFFPNFAPLLGVAAIGNLATIGKDRGALLVLEQAILPQTCRDERRTLLFTWYNVAAGIAASLGALLSGLPVLLQQLLRIDQLLGMQLMFGLYAAIALVATFPYLLLSPEVEPPTRAVSRVVAWPRQSRSIILRLASLFALDSFGGGFIASSFLSFWFFVRFGLNLDSLSLIFFVAGLLNSLSFFIAARLANRIGLIRTMVFTHLPSNFLLMAVAVSPLPWLAVAFFLGREFLSQMDVPTRQSYTMAVVPPSERTAAAGLTTLVRNAGQALGPSLAGRMMEITLAGPFLLGGGIKIAYDLLIFAMFRGIHPPEEVARLKGRARAEAAGYGKR